MGDLKALEDSEPAAAKTREAEKGDKPVKTA
jgi:hypothetical protein